MPGLKISEEDRKKIDPKFICCSCNLLLKDPMQTPCGHLICLSCLEPLTGNSNPTCPEDGAELKKEQIFPDAFTKRELKKISIHCSNEPCTWRGPYYSLEGHSGICEYALINCVHSQCKKPIKRSHLRKHLENECEYRSMKCEHCGTELSFGSVKEHIDTSCQSAPVKCRYCKLKMLRKDLKQHEDMTCEEFPGACEFQAIGCNHQKVLKRKELRQHFNDGLIYHVQLLLHLVLKFFSQLKDYIPRVEFQSVVHKIREEMSEVRVTVTENFFTLVKRTTGLERRIECLESTGGLVLQTRNEVPELKNKLTELNEEIVRASERITNVKREVREKTSAIDRLRSRLDQIDESHALNTVKITDLESVRGPAQVIDSYNGTLLWKIKGFQKKRQDAINGVKTAIYSPHFYSSQYGYKMCAKIYTNGDGFGKGSHLSLFFVLMKGDYDALQSWPFQKKITMMLLDQGNGDHMIDAFHSDPQSSSFQRPRSDKNIASGSPLFMPLDSLNNRQYIKDDVMFIKIIVD